MIKLSLGFAMPAFALVVGLNCAAVAQDKLRIAGGLAGTWENSFSELGQNAGFFKKHGLVLEIFYTEGGGETQQAVISGSADIGTGVGTFNTFGAFVKGAPIRVIAATHTGANDLTWYVKADSPIKDKKDLAGKSVAYSTAGSSTYAAVLAFQKVFGVTYTPVATGSPASTLTQVMSGQIDVGWTSPPFAVDLLRDGKIRQSMRASDVPELRNQTARFMTGMPTPSSRAGPSSCVICRPTARWSIGCMRTRLRYPLLRIGPAFRKRSQDWRRKTITRKITSCRTGSRVSIWRWQTR